MILSDFTQNFENGMAVSDVIAKTTNSFTYVLRYSCYAKKNLNNIARGSALPTRHYAPQMNTKGKTI